MSRAILKYGIEIFVVVLVLGSLLGLQVIPANGPKTEIMDGDGDTKVQVEESADEDIYRVDTDGVERFTINATGDATFLTGDVLIADGNGLIIGHTTKILASNTSEFQVLGTSGADASQVFARFSANNKAPQFNFLKSRSATIGANAIVLDDDVIGQFKFLPDDGVDYSTQAALFYAEVDDASPAVGDIGAAFVWELMPGGGGALRKVMRLFATGNLELLSTTGAFIPTLLTTTQRDALTAANGMFFYNSTLSRSQLREAGAWNSIVTSGSTDTFTNKTFDANATGNSLSNVDVADHASGTDGTIPTWDPSGNPTTFGPGTINQYVASQGEGAEPIFKSILDEDDMVSDSATDVCSQQSIKAFVTSGTVTMSGKTLTSPVLNTGISGTAFLDEDDMVSDSATKLASQQSIKKYVDDNGGGGQWTKIETKTASSSVRIDFTTLSGTYRDFMVVGSSVVPVTDTAGLLCRISIAAAFKSGASDYEWQTSELDSGVWVITENLSDASISLMADVGSTGGENMSFELNLPDPAGTALYKNIRIRAWGTNSKPDPVLVESIGFYDQATSAVDGIRFLFSTGNIESGTFTLYGRMN